MKHIHIAIMSCHKNKEIRSLCRKWLNWWRCEYRNVGYQFFVGRGTSELEPDVCQLDVPDDYQSLNYKTKAMMHHSLNHCAAPWDYVFKCDDDTWVCLPRLMDLAHQLSDSDHYVGDNHGYRCRLWYKNGMHDYAHGGAGYLLSRSAAECIATHLSTTTSTSCEDLVVGRLMKHSGVSLKSDSRFQYDFVDDYLVPKPINEIITAHYVNTPERSDSIWRHWK